MKKDKRKKVPVVYCEHCKEDTIAHIDTYKMTAKKTKEKGLKKGGFTLDVISCPQCDYVLNLDKKVKIRLWLEKTVEKRLGWKLVKK